MSIDSLREDLAQLERDVQAAVADAGHLDIAERAKTVASEIVAAEYIATTETMSDVGGIIETLGEIRVIQHEQLKRFFSDHRTTLEALMQVRSPVDLAQVGFDHWSRRAGHIAEGIKRTFDVITKERNEMSTSMTQMWKPFVELVRGDWTRR